MLKAATGERAVRTVRTAGADGWIDGLESGGRSSTIAVVVAVGMGVLAVVLAFAVLQGAISAVSTTFPHSSTTPAPVLTPAR